MGKAMLPGYLHLDCSRGLTAPMLNGAMADLLSNSAAINKAFKALDLSEIRTEIKSSKSAALGGKEVQFYVGEERLLPDMNSSAVKASNAFINACLNDGGSLRAIGELFLSEKLDARVSAVALKILENLDCPLFVEQKLVGVEALWIFCHTLMLSVQLRELDPKYVSASPIHISLHHEDQSSFINIKNRLWLNDILKFMPIIEINEPRALDVVGAAFIKAIAGSIGARGACTILHMGLGVQENMSRSDVVEAHWCEALLPDTINEVGPSNKLRQSAMVEVSGMVQAFSDMASIATMLSLHKARTLSYHLVRGEKNTDAYFLRFLVSDENKREAVEAFLLKASASSVSLRAVELAELNKRVVAVPIGHGNKSTSARFYEYIYFDKCVRVEPFKEDLDAYVKKTDYSVEVARSDLLMAWKKWRGQLVDESA